MIRKLTKTQTTYCHQPENLLPKRYTKPLEANEQGLPVHSDGYRFLDLIDKHITHWEGQRLELDQWQRDLIVRLLETYPNGELRYRQAVVSIPRQAGKSVIGSLMGLYGLTQHSRAPIVLGLARTTQQANIIYERVGNAIKADKAMARKFIVTSYRGVRFRKGVGSYKILPSKHESIQGYPSTLAVIDELHVLPETIWDAIVTSQRAQQGSIIIGVTTAGDLNSKLLIRLYKQGDAAIAGEDERFGFFVWEAEPGDSLSPETLAKANPAIACGRIDAVTTYNDEKNTPENNWRRYGLNQFVEQLEEPWVATSDWYACSGEGLSGTSDLILSVDVAPDRAYATFAATRLVDGRYEVELLACLNKPTIERMYRQAIEIREKLGRHQWIMYGYTLNDLAIKMRDRGMAVITVRGEQNTRAAATAYAAITAGTVSYKPAVNMDEDIITKQNKNVIMKTKDTGPVLTSKKGQIDSVMAMVYGIYGASIKQEKGFIVA